MGGHFCGWPLLRLLIIIGGKSAYLKLLIIMIKLIITFRGKLYSVGYTENRVLSQLFLWTPTFRGKLYSVGYTENRVSSQHFCDHKILEALSRSKKEESLWSWKNKVFTYDPELPKCLLMIICGQSAREETLEILSSEPASVAGVRFVRGSTSV